MNGVLMTAAFLSGTRREDALQCDAEIQRQERLHVVVWDAAPGDAERKRVKARGRLADRSAEDIGVVGVLLCPALADAKLVSSRLHHGARRRIGAERMAVYGHLGGKKRDVRNAGLFAEC